MAQLAFDWTPRPPIAAPVAPALALVAAPASAAVAPSAEPWQGVTPRAWQRDALPKALAAIDARQRGIVSAVMGSGKSILLAEILRQRPPGIGQVAIVTTPTVKLVDQLHATITARLAGVCDVGRYYTHAKDIAAVIVCCQPSALALAAELTARGLIVSLLIADEAHKSEAASMLAAFAALNPATAIGCTATPFRSLKTEDLSLWPVMLHEYGAKQAFADGVVVRPKLLQWEGGDTPLDDVCVTLIRRVLAIGATAGAAHFPGLANAESIADAEDFAAVLSAAGITAGVIHSKLSRDAQAAAIEALRTGQTQVLVHVNMLSEGVDLPWLRWLCMRRAVGSSVRFCQEVGRVLRAALGLIPAKDCAYLLDPHDLFDRFGLTYEAMLAGAAKEAQKRAEIDDLAAELLAPDDDGADDEWTGEKRRAMLMTRRLDQFRRYVRRLYLSLLCAGIVEQKISSTSWRGNAPSDRQLEVLKPKIGGLSRDSAVPMVHRKALGLVAENATTLKKGDVSDLLSICFAMQDRRRERLPWPDLSDAVAVLGGDDAAE